jgi:hypothetical protein
MHNSSAQATLGPLPLPLLECTHVQGRVHVESNNQCVALTCMLLWGCRPGATGAWCAACTSGMAW